jgi:uncharacterized membrane protein YccC
VPVPWPAMIRAALAICAPLAAAFALGRTALGVLPAMGGILGRTFTLRLMACMGVAGLVSEVLPLQRSYWVPLTVAIVLKPDYGSVFARALQRGIGTVVGRSPGRCCSCWCTGRGC